MENQTVHGVDVKVNSLAEPEELSESFLCCICLDLLYKPIVLSCGHISCFWCIHGSMDSLHESRCPICRRSYNHFPAVCVMLHLLLLKMYPIAYKMREKQILEEEKRMGYFSPQFDSHAWEPIVDNEFDHPGDSMDSCTTVCESTTKGGTHENMKQLESDSHAWEPIVDDEFDHPGDSMDSSPQFDSHAREPIVDDEFDHPGDSMDSCTTVCESTAKGGTHENMKQLESDSHAWEPIVDDEFNHPGDSMDSSPQFDSHAREPIVDDEFDHPGDSMDSCTTVYESTAKGGTHENMKQLKSDTHAWKPIVDNEYDHPGDSMDSCTTVFESTAKGGTCENMKQLESVSLVLNNGTSIPKQSSTRVEPVMEKNLCASKLNGDCKKITIADALCTKCKQLLVHPVVLNCGHAFCGTCVIRPTEEQLRCEVCQCLNPNGFPKVCLELAHFLEDQFCKEYASRKATVQLKKVQLKHESATTCCKEAGKLGFISSVLTEGHSLWWADPRSKVHIAVGCDSCGMYPITGDRYRCKDCVEAIGFDLCGDCYNTRSKLPGRFNQQHTPEHRLELVKSYAFSDMLKYHRIH